MTAWDPAAIAAEAPPLTPEQIAVIAAAVRRHKAGQR